MSALDQRKKSAFHPPFFYFIKMIMVYYLMIRVCSYTCGKVTISQQVTEIKKVGLAMHHPKEGEYITIQSYKHDGSLHRTWRDTMVLKTSNQSLIGCNDHTLVTEADGRRWVTREPAILYFHKKYWFNIIAMIRDNGVSYYCNLASPALIDEEGLKYIDYDLDIKVFPDGEKRLLDVDEYEDHSRKWEYPEDIDHILKENVKILVDWINEGKGPFSQAYMDIWYDRYRQLSGKQ